MSPELESPILQLLRDMRAEIGDMRADIKDARMDIRDVREQMATKGELRSQMTSLRADAAADLLVTRKELGEQIVRLRRDVVEYHTSTIGQGILGPPEQH